MKNKRPVRLIIVLGFASFLPIFLSAQIQDTLQPEKQFKNVIRYNISSPLIFGFNYVVFGYERVVKPYQSFSINTGITSLPNVVSVNLDSFGIEQAGSNPGFNLALDYRFYLQKENRYLAPHGIYLAPFYAFNIYNRTDSWSYEDSNGTSVFFEPKIKLNIHSIGGQLGYQFVLGKRKRFTLDLVLVGPSLSFYKLKVGVTSEATIPENDVLEAVIEMLKKQIPGFERVFEGEEVSTTGTFNTRFLGFRYLVHVGYRF